MVIVYPVKTKEQRKVPFFKTSACQSFQMVKWAMGLPRSDDQGATGAMVRDAREINTVS